jgi:hypothetical protein
VSRPTKPSAQPPARREAGLRALRLRRAPGHQNRVLAGHRWPPKRRRTLAGARHKPWRRARASGAAGRRGGWRARAGAWRARGVLGRGVGLSSQCFRVGAPSAPPRTSAAAVLLSMREVVGWRQRRGQRRRCGGGVGGWGRGARALRVGAAARGRGRAPPRPLAWVRSPEGCLLFRGPKAPPRPLQRWGQGPRAHGAPSARACGGEHGAQRLRWQAACVKSARRCAAGAAPRPDIRGSLG